MNKTRMNVLFVGAGLAPALISSFRICNTEDMSISICNAKYNKEQYCKKDFKSLYSNSSNYKFDGTCVGKTVISNPNRVSNPVRVYISQYWAYAIRPYKI